MLKRFSTGIGNLFDNSLLILVLPHAIHLYCSVRSIIIHSVGCLIRPIKEAMGIIIVLYLCEALVTARTHIHKGLTAVDHCEHSSGRHGACHIQR